MRGTGDDEVALQRLAREAADTRQRLVAGGLFYVLGWFVVSAPGQVLVEHPLAWSLISLAFLGLAIARFRPAVPADGEGMARLQAWLDRQWGVVLATAALWGGVLSWVLLDPHLAGGRSAALLCTIAFATAFAHNYALRRNRALLGVAMIYLPAALLLPHTDERLSVGITVAVYSIYLAVVLLRSYREYQHQLDLYDALRMQRDQYERLSRIDPLTGVANRRSFSGALEHHVGEARRSGRPLAMLVLDLDHFKRVNDELGHDAGDACLVRFADRMREMLGVPGSHLARLGGEEFGVLLPGHDAQAAAALAEAMRASLVQRPLQLREGPLALTVSIGVAVLHPEAGEGGDELYRAADHAMYRAKAEGRNLVRVEGA
ncbi:GGDEF domain-containing protein [Arenimonas sp.]|uniref:GGDEF domain-containing protein n=1 Tax=Arenimonas sp. TaxID=1872635 RepID=UPI0035B4443F